MAAGPTYEVAGTLAYIRKKFVEETGRFDLVVDVNNWADQGANFFIQAGSRLLDMMLENKKTVKRFQKDIAVGDHKIEMKYLRAVERVEFSDGVDKFDIPIKPYSKIRDLYTKPVASIENGTPSEYSMLVNMLSPELKALTSADFTTTFTYDSEDIRFYDQDPFLYDGIIWYPPSDKIYTVTIHGWFFSALEVDTDTSFYSVNHPELLILASKLVLYSFYDNTQGVRDMAFALNITLESMDRDMVEVEVKRSGLVRKGL